MGHFKVGLAFDYWGPQAEGAAVRDLMALQDEASKDGTVLQVVCDRFEIDNMLAALAIEKVGGSTTFWIKYRSTEGPVDAISTPGAKTVTVRNLVQKRDGLNTLRPGAESEVFLKDFSRDNNFNPLDRPAPVNNGQTPTDPYVALMFG